MGDVNYAKLALYVVGANLTFQFAILLVLHLWKTTMQQIASSRLKKLHDASEVPLCGAPFHCHCDELQGHLKAGMPHVSSSNLVAWRDE